MKQGMEKAYGLTEQQLEEIRQLDLTCSQSQPLNMKLNWDMLISRPADELNDFLYYINNKLVGFLGLYGIGPSPEEIEITGMIDPGYRRKGLFSELFLAAKDECMRRKAGRMLWVCERSSASGVAFAKHSGAEYTFSEYRLRFIPGLVPGYPQTGLQVRPAKEQDYPELMNLDFLSFGSLPSDGVDIPLGMYENSYVGILEHKIVGKVRLIMENRDGGIYGFAVLPEYRGRGFGKEILSRAMEILLTEYQAERIFLEVSIDNQRALQLYKGCGFEEVTVYDYYALPLD